MAYMTDRVALFDSGGSALPDVSPAELLGRVRAEEVNGEHTLTLTTTRRLEPGWRALTQDAQGKWREWVVEEPDELHDSGGSAVGTYTLVWSLQHDLQGVFGSVVEQPGMASPCGAATALAAALSGTTRWAVGTVDVAGTHGALMVGQSAWERLSQVVQVWGGEVDAEIGVDLSGVTSRRVALRAHLGQAAATRRFDWGRDLTGARRTPEPGPYFCRVVPLGRGETEYAEDDRTEFSWPIDITSVHGGVAWLQDDDAALAFRVADGRGGWEYPTKVVTYDTDDEEELLELARADLKAHTTPKVTYEASVSQLAVAGQDALGVALGDEVHVVDRLFNPDAALRLTGRVVRVEADELDPTATALTIGSLATDLGSRLGSLTGSLADLSARSALIEGRTADLESASNAAYVRHLIARLNEEANATGGYTYIVPGEGTITYDVAVSDPSVGAEASQAVQVKGGNVRIANTKTSGGAWEWKTVLASGVIATGLVSATNIVSGTLDADLIRAGRITSAANPSNYWDLDTGELRVDGGSVVVNSTALDVTVGGLTSNRAYCDTPASTQTKTVTLPRWVKREGATLTVQFGHANTAANPRLSVLDGSGNAIATSGINVNSYLMSQKMWWKDGDVMTFVWDGFAFQLSEGGAMSRIQAAMDSITLSVTNGQIGKSASIVLSADGATTTKTIDMRAVRSAWADDTTAVTVTAGTVTFNSNTFLVNSTNLTVAADGTITATNGSFTGTVTATSGSFSGTVTTSNLTATGGTIGGMTIASSSMYNESVTLDARGVTLRNPALTHPDIGTVGRTYWTGTSNHGLMFGLEYWAWFMSWGVRETSTASDYTAKLMYSNGTWDSFVTGRLNFLCPTDHHGYVSYNTWIDPNTGGASGGVTGTLGFVRVMGMNSNGTASSWSSASLTFKNGMLTSASWTS